ncbi:hypothetical protein GDO81_027622 [Engystomops pustulosus]|uniref:Uncharacterized protein n=1 Tax=Engystomops pustulosus TaxID=76066 RepID=A0AAV6YLL8_ENGPU|nr:hypothetical protein GDO81_027622 [Engystomops pustulosus]
MGLLFMDRSPELNGICQVKPNQCLVQWEYYILIPRVQTTADTSIEGLLSNQGRGRVPLMVWGGMGNVQTVSNTRDPLRLHVHSGQFKKASLKVEKSGLYKSPNQLYSLPLHKPVSCKHGNAQGKGKEQSNEERISSAKLFSG